MVVDSITVTGRRVLLAMCAICMVAISSCTLALDWDEENLPCLRGECAEGYSCLVNRCVEDGSLAKDETCNNSAQCADGRTCPPGVFVCRDICAQSAYYQSSTDCFTNEYCKPIRVSDKGATPKYEAVCMKSECEEDSDCGLANACVRINLTASACLERCQITWEDTSDSNGYSDNCGGQDGEPAYCLPVGLDADVLGENTRSLVCLPTTSAAQNEGGVCTNFIISPCEKTLACINGQCLRHCDTEAAVLNEGCAGSDICCAINLTTDTFGVCATTCSELN